MAEEDAGKKAEKCLKLLSGARTSCLYSVREKEIRRKGRLAARMARERGRNLKARVCKKLSRAKAHKCKKGIKHETAREIRLIWKHIVRAVQRPSMEDIAGEAQFSFLISKAQKCPDLQCQMELASKSCPRSQPLLSVCTRVVLQVPLNHGSKNAYFSAIRSSMASCKTRKCKREVFGQFRLMTEWRVRLYSKYATKLVMLKYAKVYKKCTDEHCQHDAFMSALEKAKQLSETALDMTYRMTLRSCKKLHGYSSVKKCKKLAGKERKRELKMSLKTLGKRLRYAPGQYEAQLHESDFGISSKSRSFKILHSSNKPDLERVDSALHQVVKTIFFERQV